MFPKKTVLDCIF